MGRLTEYLHYSNKKNKLPHTKEEIRMIAYIDYTSVKEGIKKMRRY